jgi:2-methylisocitrate lyase-like PEP mutase family enzyme
VPSAITPAQRIRDLLAAGGTINMPGVYDALTARLAAEAGFEVLFVSGYSVSASRLGMPDLGYIGMADVADAARGICAAVAAPVIVDADTGYGNALSARRTARVLHAAGAAGIFLEDQEWPKRCGHFAGKRVVPREEWLAKLRAVLDLREEGVDLFLVARTDARAAVSLDEAIARAAAARDLGVDAIFVEAPRSEDELREVAERVGGSIRVANMIERGRTPMLTPAELGELGHRLIVTPLTALFAATKAVRDAMALLRAEGTMREHLDGLVAFDAFEEVVDLPGHHALEERYLAAPEDATTAPGPG